MDLFWLLLSYVIRGAAAGCTVLTMSPTSFKAVIVQVIINDEI
jgi:hypothetical protein